MNIKYYIFLVLILSCLIISIIIHSRVFYLKKKTGLKKICLKSIALSTLDSSCSKTRMRTHTLVGKETATSRRP